MRTSEMISVVGVGVGGINGLANETPVCVSGKISGEAMEDVDCECRRVGVEWVDIGGDMGAVQKCEGDVSKVTKRVTPEGHG